MAGRNGIRFAQFKTDFRKAAEQIKKDVADIVVETAIEAHVALVTATPFKTGTARSNWNPSIGVPDLSVKPKQNYPEYQDKVPNTAVAAETARERAEEVFGPLRGKGNLETLYISNGTEYIGILDNGRSEDDHTGSPQAPVGILVALDRVEENLKQRNS